MPVDDKGPACHLLHALHGMLKVGAALGADIGYVHL